MTTTALPARASKAPTTFRDETNPDHAAFYVSAIDNSTGRAWLLAGPYGTHAAALARVRAVKDRAIEGRPQAVFYAYGTCSAPAHQPDQRTPLGPDW